MAREQGDDPEVGVKTALQAILVSPHFLFRVELDRDARANGLINDSELASRLSYFLWSSMPDEELFTSRQGKEAAQARRVEAQVQRMLKDPKAQALAENFASQWLKIRGLAGFSPDPKRFPTFNESLRRGDAPRDGDVLLAHRSMKIAACSSSSTRITRSSTSGWRNITASRASRARIPQGQPGRHVRAAAS